MKTVKVAVIRDVTDYHEVLERINQIYDAEPGSDEFFELKILSQQVEEFEAENFPIPEADPIEIIEFILEQNGLKQNYLVGILGEKSTVSKVLNRKRPLTIEMIRNFSRRFNVRTDALIKEYI
jgi:HTH-type transcriptional regulator / antitoxin HigA